MIATAPAVARESGQEGLLSEWPFLRIPSYRDTPPASLHSGDAIERLSKAEADPSAFTLLPAKTCEQIGLYTRKGARLDLAVLSALLAHARRNPDGFSVQVAGGPLVEAEAGEFWVSLKSVSEDILRRWIGERPDAAFARKFYRRVRLAADRLSSAGYVTPVRTAAPGKNHFGHIWTLGPSLRGIDLAALPSAPVSPVLLLEGRPEPKGGERDYLCAIDLVQSAFFKDNPELYTRAEGRYRLFEKGREVDYLRYMRRVAEKSTGSDSMLSAGAWKKGQSALDDSRSEAPCHFPFIVLDIDGSDPWESRQAAGQVVEDLIYHGAKASDLIVSYTGGRGFHVRIPAAVVGSPVFRGAREAQRVLREWAASITEEDVDPCTFSPVQPVRMIGSFREESNMYVRAWNGEDFLDLSMERIMEACVGHEPFYVPRPYEATLAPALALAMAEASDATRMSRIPVYADTDERGEQVDMGGGEVVAKAMEGVSEGEVWFEDGKRCHVGRSKAMFIIACHLMRTLNEHAALEKMREINRRFDPPLSHRELRGRLTSAKRTLIKDGQIVVRT